MEPTKQTGSPSYPVQILKQRSSLWPLQQGVLVGPDVTLNSSLASSFNSFVNLSLTNLESHMSPAVSGQDILLVSDHVTNWQRLLRHLFTPEDCGSLLRQLEADSINLTIKETCARGLDEWKKRKGSEATVFILLASLQKIQRMDVFEKLKQRHFPDTQDLLPGLSSTYSMTGSVSSAASSYTSMDASQYCLPEKELHEEVFLEIEGTHATTSRMLERILKEFKDPDKSIISLVGPPKSGKTTTLNSLQKRLQDEGPFENTRVVKVSGSLHMDGNLLKRRIAEEITRKPQVETDQSKAALRALQGLLLNHNEIILLLDLSIVTFSREGKSVCDSIVKLKRDQKLATSLRIVVTAVTSFKLTALFSQNRSSTVELVMEPLSESEAIKYIKDKDPNFSKRIASYIVSKIECFPFYLARVTEMGLESALVVESKESQLQSIECNFEPVANLLCVEEVKETLQAVVDCLGEAEKHLLIQLLTFTSSFNIEQANRIVDNREDLEDKMLNPFCEQGSLLLTRKSVDFKGTVYQIPRISGSILRSIATSTVGLSNFYSNAILKYQEMFLKLLVYLSNCFMGMPVSPAEELCVLEPFTPSDGVPEEMSLAGCSKDERVMRVVRLVREAQEDITKSLMVYSDREDVDVYSTAVSAATKLNVCYLLLYMFRPLLAIKIYRRMKKEALSRKDQMSVAKINVCIATLKTSINGSKKFMSEAKSLYQASSETLAEIKDANQDVKILHIHCLQRIGVCLLAESLKDSDDAAKDLFDKGMQCIEDAKTSFLQLPEDAVGEVYAADCRQMQAAFYLEKKMDAEASGLLDDSVPVLERSLGRKHPLTCNGYFVRCSMYMMKKSFAEAKSILYLNSEMEEALLGAHWQTARTMHQIAVCIWDKLQGNEPCYNIMSPLVPHSDWALGDSQSERGQDGSDPSSPTTSGETLRSETYSAILLDEDDIQEIRRLLKQSLRHMTSANEKCEELGHYYLMLAKTSKLLGKSREETFFELKANQYLKTF